MKWHVTGFVVLAGLLVWAGCALVVEPLTPRVRAQGSEDEYVATPLIDCSTNSGFRDNLVAETFRAAEPTTAGGQQCNACHQNAHPEPGQGDRPRASFASVLVANRSNKAVTYEARAAVAGADWKEFTLPPGKMVRHTWTFAKANQRTAPAYQLRYASDPEQRTRKLIPMATPNKNLGNIYFFDSEDQHVYLYKPNATVARARR